jgi:hypothetical protein
MVVPEPAGFEVDGSHENGVWVPKKWGNPQLARSEGRSVAPLWLNGGIGVTRVDHNRAVRDAGEATAFKRGHALVLPSPWSTSGQRRRFASPDLSVFDVAEISPGLLRAIPQ